MSSPSNPFSTLLDQPSGPKSTGDRNPDEPRKEHFKTDTTNSYDEKVNALIQNILLITIRQPTERLVQKRSKPLVFVEETASTTGNPFLNLQNVERALFERIILQSPSDHLIPGPINTSNLSEENRAIETKVLIYLYDCFRRLNQYRNINDSINIQVSTCIEELLLRNGNTAHKQPDLFPDQSLTNQWLSIMKQTDDTFQEKSDFLSAITRATMNDDSDSISDNYESLKHIFHPLLTKITDSLATASLTSIPVWIGPTLMTFVSDKQNTTLGELLIDFCTPPDRSSGSSFAHTLIGQLLSLSILPREQNGKYEYYGNVKDQSTVTALNNSLWTFFKSHMDVMYDLVKGLLVMGGTVRTKMLNWFGRCLYENRTRGQMWNAYSNQIPDPSRQAIGSDAFMIGICNVLLRLCLPLCKPELKVLLVDPTYCAVPNEDRDGKQVHMIDISKETCLLPVPEPVGEETGTTHRLTASTYNFITELFFLTHRAIDLGYRVCVEQFFQKQRQMQRLQMVYGNPADRGAMSEELMRMLEPETQQILSIQNLLLEPYGDELITGFYEATAIWLTRIVAARDVRDSGSYAPKNLPVNDDQLPIFDRKSEAVQLLCCIPEFIIENIVGFLTFTRNFDTVAIDSNPDAQTAIFTMILIFMGRSEHARNPHLRARLAEGLESLLPKDVLNPSVRSDFRTGFRTALFTKHPHRKYVIANLLRVFVAIEMTGESVQFEQKFNYRRPMYKVMKYLWDMDEQRECFRELARDAEMNIDRVDPPIFLRFINLLINDAIFLLDESLSNLQQIRQLQQRQDAGDFERMGPEERRQQEGSLYQLGMLARFDNVLGRATINMLRLLTGDIQGIFCHCTMVDRIAAMLNYFLLKLVGPEKGNFKVKDKKEYEFDPANTVLEICQIYINLEKSNEFCLAVTHDGRSYSPKLFEYAEQVLVRVGGGQLIGEIKELAEKIRRIDAADKETQEQLADAPDHFLDPIMSTLMTDPVILPSSNVIVDRTTISRHLLSDQSDPFNRSPLTMEMIKSDVKLKGEIEQWIKMKKSQPHSD